MKKADLSGKTNKSTKNGYNEKNPAQPEGAFPPASGMQHPKRAALKSNTADKKSKEDTDH